MFNFLRFAQEYHVPFISSGHHHCTSGWLQTHCPQCAGGSHGFHLGFSLTRGNFSCWVCRGVSALTVIQHHARCSRDEAKRIYYEFSDGKKTAPKREKHQETARKRTLKAPQNMEPLSRVHWKYLTDPIPEGRGFTKKQAKRIVEEWDLRGTRHLSLLWNWRIVGPILNPEGDTVAYVGRSIRDIKPKYRVTEDEKCLENPRTFLYGIEKVESDRVIVVEGPGDAWNIGPGSIATLGVKWTPEKANRIRRFKHRYLMYDPDKDGQKRAQELAEWLAYFPGETTIVDDIPSDPGSLSPKTVKKIRRILLGE